MKLLDVNVALYAYVPEAAEHDRARTWFEALLSGREPVLFPLATLLGFARISTDIRVFASRSPLRSRSTSLRVAWR